MPRKADKLGIPSSISEQIENSHEAFDAGASIVHVFVRKAGETPTFYPERFAELKIRLEKQCPKMVVQFTTESRSGVENVLGGMLPLRLGMASLSVGSNNFPRRVYEKTN